MRPVSVAGTRGPVSVVDILGPSSVAGTRGPVSCPVCGTSSGRLIASRVVMMFDDGDGVRTLILMFNEG